MTAIRHAQAQTPKLVAIALTQKLIVFIEETRAHNWRKRTNFRHFVRF